MIQWNEKQLKVNNMLEKKLWENKKWFKYLQRSGDTMRVGCQECYMWGWWSSVPTDVPDNWSWFICVASCGMTEFGSIAWFPGCRPICIVWNKIHTDDLIQLFGSLGTHHLCTDITTLSHCMPTCKLALSPNVLLAYLLSPMHRLSDLVW